MCIFGLISSACGGGGGSGPAPLSKEALADRELGQKLAAYVAFANDNLDRVYASRRRYLSWVADPQVGPTCKERHVYGLYKISKPDPAVEKLRIAKELPPKLPDVEEQGRKLLATYSQLHDLLEQAHRYYDQKEYKEDGCKRGQAMHPKLMEGFARFEKEEVAYTATLTQQSLAIQARILGRAEKKHGKDDPRVLYRQISLEARQVLAQLRVEEGKATAVDGPAKAVDALDALVRRLGEKQSQKAPEGLDSFVKQANAFTKVCKERMRRLKSGKALSASELEHVRGGSGWMVDGSYPKVIRTFNELIEAANRVKGS
jgi:hypothetical protein